MACGPFAFLTELLAAIPSVIYGLWAIFVLAPLLRDYVEPLLAKIRDGPACFRARVRHRDAGGRNHSGDHDRAHHRLHHARSDAAVPQNQREAVLALGATRWEMIRIGVLRNARSGNPRRRHSRTWTRPRRDHGSHHGDRKPAEIAKSLFAPGYTMASVIANEFSEATGRSLSERLGRDRAGALPGDLDCERTGAVAGLDSDSRHSCEGQCIAQPSTPACLRVGRRIQHLEALTGFTLAAAVRRPRAYSVGAIFGYLVYQGHRVDQLGVPHTDPKPVGEAGGGMANAIVGPA